MKNTSTNKYLSLKNRLIIWIRRPISHKIISINSKLKNAAHKLLISILRLVVFTSFFQCKLWRRLAFDLKPKGELILAGGNLKFVVSTADITIGRTTFVNRHPFDLEKLEYVSSLLPATHKRKRIIDIGANIGTICIGAVGNNIYESAIAIEPEPLNYSLLTANVHINKLAGKVSCHNLALGGRDGEYLKFELCSDNHGDHRVKTNGNTSLFGEDDRKNLIVPSETFDSVVSSLSADEDLIWMDTQGYEGHVLSGAKLALSQRIPLCTEFWPYGMERSGCFEMFKKLLIEAGYRYFIDLSVGVNPIALTDESLNLLRAKLGDSGAYTDIYVYYEENKVG